MEPNPKNAGQKLGYHSDSQRIGRKVTTASKDWDMTRRKRSNGDTDERERERRVLRPERLWKRSGRCRLKSIFTKNQRDSELWKKKKKDFLEYLLLLIIVI
jgi:hypothetical protein